MAMAPAAISASPAVTTILDDATAPDKPAARAKGTVKPSDMPMTTSRTFSPDVKCFSTCGVDGISSSPSLEPRQMHQDERDRPWDGLDEQDFPVGGDGPEDPRDDHAGEKEDLDAETGGAAEAQAPDQARGEETVVEPLVRGERGRGRRKLGSQPEGPAAVRLVPQEHLDREEVEVQSSHQAHDDVRDGFHGSPPLVSLLAESMVSGGDCEARESAPLR